MPRGVLITFEGVEGCGKSTLMRRLTAGLEDTGRSVETMREPGGTALGERIRSVVLDGDEHEPVQAWSELFLMLAARAQLVRERVQPYLGEGRIVFCDRYMDASVAYQGGGRGLGVELVQRLNSIATDETPPDLTFLLDLDPQTGRDRQSHAPDRMEREDLAFHEAVRATYLALAESEPHRFRVLDGREPPDDLAATAWSYLASVVDGMPTELPKNVKSDDSMELLDV